MKRQTIWGMIAAFALAIIPFVAPSPALADTVNGVTCNSYHSLNPTEGSQWPNDWSATSEGHFFICTTFTGNQVQQVKGAILSVPQTHRTLFQNKGVTYFLFATRANAISYMSGKTPYAGHSEFQGTNTRCGHTAYNPNLNVIAAEIYATCEYSTGAVTNPNLNAVTVHETGHVFDFALALNSTHPGTPFSKTLAFKNLFSSSTNTATAGSDAWALDHDTTWSVKPQTCVLFVGTTPPLEHDLGLPTSVNTPVCVGGVVQAPFTGLDNFGISIKQDPYFVTPSPATSRYIELFAAMYAANIGVASPDPLGFLDSYIQRFRCIDRTMEYFINTFAPPPNNQLTFLSCPVPAAVDWTKTQ